MNSIHRYRQRNYRLITTQPGNDVNQKQKADIKRNNPCREVISNGIRKHNTYPMMAKLEPVKNTRIKNGR